MCVREIARVERGRVCTCDTAVGRLEVGDEVLAARLNTEQLGVGHGDDAAGASVTAQLNVVEHVSETADIVVDRQTATDTHATVASSSHQNHFVVPRAGRVERFPLTELVHRRQQHYNNNSANVLKPSSVCVP